MAAETLQDLDIAMGTDSHTPGMQRYHGMMYEPTHMRLLGHCCGTCADCLFGADRLT